MPLQSRSGQSSCLSNWYHGSLSREETERKMAGTGLPNGSFLVRYSHSTRKYVLSVLHDHTVYHYPIEELTDGFYQVHGTNAKYLGIDLLVAEFRRTNACIVCTLSRPVSGGIRPPSHFVVYGVTNELHLAVRKGNLKGAKEVLLREQQQHQQQLMAGGGEAASVNGKESPSLFLIVNAKSSDNGATPIIEAAKTGSSDLVKLLLDWDSEVNLRDCGGCTALHRACQKSFAHVAETLLKQGRANPQIKCPFSGNTPLHEAAMLGHTDCVNTLLRFHAAAWARNLDGEMPFELAHRFGFRELGEALAAYRPPQPLTTQVDWFHPDLSKQETEQFLLSIAASRGNGAPEDGVFLVRRSSRHGDKKYVLAVTCKGSCLKYKIEWMTDFPAAAGGGLEQGAFFIDKGPLYPSLDHLVEHYCRFVDGIPVRLRLAVNTAAREPASPGAGPDHGVILVEKLVPLGVEQRDREPLKIRAASGAAVSAPGDGVAAFGERSSSGYRNEHFSRVVPRAGGGAASAHPKRRSAGDSSSGSTGSSSAASLPPSELGAPALAGAGGAQLRLIPCESVILLYRLGEGEFGAVFHGQLINSPGGPAQAQQAMDVAVKVLVQPSARLDFLKEASVMMQLAHPNILGMYGICENKRLMMLLELAPLGALLDYLQENAEMVQLPSLYRWAEQIADGMAYLESRGFVHRDLACRNVLLCSEAEAKISDFGLSRAVGVDTDYYKATRRGKWPVKWYAPESIYYKTFSHASDVWSYGVCLWEMFSLGDHPYDHWDGFEVLKQVEEGYRMPHPKLATHRVYQLMKNCWAYKPEDRPSFAELLRAFRHLVVNVYENVQPPEMSLRE